MYYNNPETNEFAAFTSEDVLIFSKHYDEVAKTVVKALGEDNV